MKYYQVLFIDEYDNIYELGNFATLKEAEPIVNEYLKQYELNEYDVESDGGVPCFGEKTNLGHLFEYASTFNTCFDRIIPVSEGSISVRGFIKDTEDTMLEMMNILERSK